jgi:hypothetical protein
MVFADLARAAVLLSMPLAFAAGGVSLVHLCMLVGLRPALWIAAAGMFLAAVPSSTGRLTALPEPALDQPGTAR